MHRVAPVRSALTTAWTAFPCHADWYVYPRSGAAWAADASVIFDEQGLRRLDDTFRGHLDRREVQPPAPKDDMHRLLPYWLRWRGDRSAGDLLNSDA